MAGATWLMGKNQRFSLAMLWLCLSIPGKTTTRR